jgi:hypothetical protein
MSNHGKESTNEEGVNIGEMQTKIVMGKLITETTACHITVALNLNVMSFPMSISICVSSMFTPS